VKRKKKKSEREKKGALLNQKCRKNKTKRSEG
jgi:hypothetical protein